MNHWDVLPLIVLGFFLICFSLISLVVFIGVIISLMDNWKGE